MARIFDPVLLKKLAKKRGKSEKYIREKISRSASTKGLSPATCFVLELIKEKIPSAVYQRSLLENVRTEIREGLSQNIQVSKSIPKRNAEEKIQRAQRIFKIENLKVTPKPTILKQAEINSANENAEIYQALFIFENSVRYLISKTLEKKYGKDWWNHTSGTFAVVNNKIKTSVSKRMVHEKINAFHGSRGVSEIYYTDFSELSTILKNNANIFNPIFNDIEGGLGFLTHRLDELSLSRNTIAHTAALKSRDRKRFLLYFEDWYEQLDIINSRI